MTAQYGLCLRILACKLSAVSELEIARMTNSGTGLHRQLIYHRRYTTSEVDPFNNDNGDPAIRRKRYTEEPIISLFKEREAIAGVLGLSRRHGVVENTVHRWKSKFGGIGVANAKRLRELEAENAKLKRMYAEEMLDYAALKELNARKWQRPSGDGWELRT